MNQFWGKLKKDNTGKLSDSLSLADHCVDVAIVFRSLCELSAFRRILNRAAGIKLNKRQLDRLAFFAFLHDLGKCNWGFQSKRDTQPQITASHIKETLPLFFNPDLAKEFYKVFECDRLISWFDGPESVFRLFLSSISHHGRPAFTMDERDSLACESAVKFWKPFGSINPVEGLEELFKTAQNVFPDAFDDVADPVPVTETLQHRFAGMLMLADWLGSHSEAFFPFQHSGSRADWSRFQARRALKSVGLDISEYLGGFHSKPQDFSSIFGFKPFPLQSRLAETNLPSLLIAESDTGSGKTEAALIHFLSLFGVGAVDSLYFALPTRVAAREVYDRVLKTVRRAFGENCPPVLLAVPGYVRIDGEPVYILPSEDRIISDDEEKRHGRGWVAKRPKRFLAATVAVGTIDQALLSTIRVKHAHLRRICLDRSLLVMDEVHSSDVYMRALSRNMLAEHLKVGGRALLLSATLGSTAREEYLNLHDSTQTMSFKDAVELPYPSLSSFGSRAESLVNPDYRQKTVILDPVLKMENPEDLLPRIEQAVTAGLRVLIILNTVKRAITVFRAADAIGSLKNLHFSCNGVCCPHHGRFAKTDREILDREVTHRMGKGSPSGSLLLIGTQTLEQSLDIDADWLVTDLCPMDVLLQRIGRLHRHDRGKRPDAVCSVLLPRNEDLGVYLRDNGEVSYIAPAGLGGVYEDLRILQLTRDIVAAAPIIHLPMDNRRLVEEATHTEKIGSLKSKCWELHGQYIEGKIQAMLMAADGAVIPNNHFGEFSFPRSIDTHLITRLGLDNRHISLKQAYTGPFGLPVDELDIPGHMARDLETDVADTVEVLPEGFKIGVERHSYRYSRFGLEKMDELANG